MSEVVFKGVCLKYYLDGYEKESQQRNAITAADNLNFHLKKNDRIGLIGRNGSGKSTLLSLIAGNLVPQSGLIEIKGDRLALVNRASGLEPRASLYENAVLRGYAYALKGQELNSFVENVLQSSGLSGRSQSPLNTLSTGMLGRFNIALNSQIVKPITILDEWVGTLNVSSFDGDVMLNKLANEAEIVVFASHNESLIKNLCNRVILLDKGAIVYDGDDVEKGLNILSCVSKLDPDYSLTLDEIEKELRLKQEEGIYDSSFAELQQEDSKQGLQSEPIDAPIYTPLKKKNLHFMNIGRCLVSSIKAQLETKESDRYNFVFHSITSQLSGIPKEEEIVIIYRDPLVKFISGFYSRALQGKPEFQVSWTDGEKQTFKNFSSPAELLTTLADSDENMQKLAISSLIETEFLNKSLSWYFGEADYLLSRKNDIVVLANADEPNSLVVRLSSLLECELDAETLTSEDEYVMERSSPADFDIQVVESFQSIYSCDYKFFGLLERLAHTKYRS